MITEEQEEFLRKNTFDFTIVSRKRVKGLKRDWIHADIEIKGERVDFQGSVNNCIKIIELLKGE